MSTTIILTIFNKEKILNDVLMALFNMTSDNVIEYIFVLDGCVDNSEIVLKSMLNTIPHGVIYKILHADDVFELRANNIGLRECKTEYAILVQDDMIITEKNWDKRLLKPVLTFNDIWAVTARTSCSLKTNGTWYNIVESRVGHNLNNPILPRDRCYVGQVINRGPLLIKMDIFKKENFYDETLPGVIGCDDVEMSLRMYKKYGLRCCQYWISYLSPIEWGSARNGPNSVFCSQQESLNRNEVIHRYRDILSSWANDEVRILE